jgi:hypothetical protein
MSDPVGEGNASTRPQHAVRLAHGIRELGYMEQRFLTYDRVVASVGQWQGGHIALDDLNLAVQPNTSCQLRGTRNSRRRQFDAGDKCTIAVRQVTGWAAQSGAQVNDLGARAYMRALGQRIIGGDAAIVVLIMREQLLRTQSIKCAACCLQLGEDHLRRYRMTVVKINGCMGFVRP